MGFSVQGRVLRINFLIKHSECERGAQKVWKGGERAGRNEMCQAVDGADADESPSLTKNIRME